MEGVGAQEKKGFFSGITGAVIGVLIFLIALVFIIGIVAIAILVAVMRKRAK